MTQLHYETLVLDGTPRAGDGRLPSGESFVTSPLTLTLITGERDAVLVDAPYTYGQIERTRNWIKDSGKRLAFVYITHGHGDHWLGVEELLKAFPDTAVYATESTLAKMATEVVEGRAAVWDPALPGLVPPASLVAEVVPEVGLELEGERLEPIHLGHTDTDGTTALWVPSIELVVAGDAIYNGAHQYVLESGDGGLEQWLEAIDKIEALSPKYVVAGHKAPGAGDDPSNIQATRQYLLDARDALAAAGSPKDYYDTMLRRYPHHVNASPVWYGALGLLGG
ncbi:MBL fold metallo-hydrolase [Arthrobacter sp. NtRootA1]|uniref:MBL fold metallo-hydrolase n=1 Tax=Arthrobacter sp. NtRootA1 TaxID=2830983 RepID=UPI001CC6D5B5|nr:MBL fold metallo-hydrolase [Arthrobacter sp. NtRootA1]BCW05702.1 MBL fold metallo-hydrolase [Arthrobacter sp. NtRootA1]